VAMLLAAAGEPRDVRKWTAEMWASLGRDLGSLHTMPPPSGGEWAARRDALSEALTAPRVEQVTAFWGMALPLLPVILARRAELAEQIAGLPPVFVHGDCHTGNLVHSAGSLVFCDWQAASIGRPGSDLAFLSVRAAPLGVAVPDDLVDGYLERRPCDRQALRRALLAEELATFVFLWPPFAMFNDAAGIARVHRRARALADQWTG
jgi:aminoglycoside phosphotransferase (APT) family kinase protein